MIFIRPATRLILTLVLLTGLPTASAAEIDTTRPNIVYILADDLGIGDVHAFNPGSRIATPHLDRLAAEGMKFTDAHSGSAVCTPTRYGILTGRYAWRTRLQSGVLWGYSLPLITPERLTVGSLLQQQGYRTACIGKWHLGLQWGLKDEAAAPSDRSQETWDNIDFAQPLKSGPLQVGFDSFYGISASLDMHPHVYLRDNQVTSVPQRIIEKNDGKAFWREGPIGEDFRHVDVLDQLTKTAADFISDQSSDQPFFLYFPLTAPHKPILPHERFREQSGLNEWGDFVMQVDWTVGQVMQALDAGGLTNNTLIIVTSDNGATPGADFKTLDKLGHKPSGPYRGNKADIYEGGHRVAFLARWPAVIEAGDTCSHTICLTDLLATAADITNFELPDGAGEDSVSLLPLMQHQNRAVRESTIHHSINGSFAIRRGQWKLCFCPGSGGWSQPRPPQAREQQLPALQLFDLSADVAEANNLAAQHPEIVAELSALLQQSIDHGRSTPGEPQPNDREIAFPTR